MHGAGAIKAELIERDPYEDDSRRTLGFGHAIAHPLETVTSTAPSCTARPWHLAWRSSFELAAARGLLATDRHERMLGLLRRVELPTTAAELPAEVDGRRLLDATERIRLIRGGGYRFVLPIDLGETVVADDVTPAELRGALRPCGIDVAP